MKELNSSRLFLGFLFIWLIINALQAAFTGLDPDEAYYWMYSRQLDWGYFDHPPAIAVLIKLGYALIPNELGVRLGAIVLQTLSFYIIWLILGKPKGKSKIWTLIALLAAMPMLEVYGFIATPDAPLLFFSVLFFWLYQRFLAKDSWINTLLLGVCMAALLYSKYHGVILIFFTLLSNLKLLLKPKFYIASIFGALLFVPHLYWQFSHDFPSFRYHLVGRDDPYELKHTITYIVNQLVIFNPFIFPMIVLAMIRKPITDRLERAFYFIIFGFWIFFLYTTSKGHVEPQWTNILSIPFVILTWRYSVQDANFIFDKWLKRLAFGSLLLLLAARLALVEGNIFNIKSNFHRSAWIAELQAKTQGLPVVFQNSYRDPSLFAFYTGNQAFTFTDANYRKNQYDIWNWEKILHNQRVAIAGQPGWDCAGCKPLELTRKNLMLKIVDSLQISQKVHFEFEAPKMLSPGDTVGLDVAIYNPYEHTILLDAGNMPLRMVVIFYRDERVNGKSALQFEQPLMELPANETTTVKARFEVPFGLQGEYVFALGIQTGDLPPSFNSSLSKVKID